MFQSHSTCEVSEEFKKFLCHSNPINQCGINRKIDGEVVDKLKPYRAIDVHQGLMPRRLMRV